MKLKITAIRLTFAYTVNCSQELLDIFHTPFESLHSQDLEQLARYFLFQLQQSEYTDLHSSIFLNHYLSQIALDAANLVCSQLKNSPNPKLHYPIADVKAIAQKLAQPALIFKDFDLDSDSSIENYALTVMVNLIKKQIVQQLNSPSLAKKYDIEILLDISRTQLREALSKYGLKQEEMLNRYLATWLAFKQLSSNLFPHTSPCVRSIPSALDEMEHGAIASLGNQLLWRSSSLILIPLNSKQVAHILSICAKAIRNY